MHVRLLFVVMAAVAAGACAPKPLPPAPPPTASVTPPGPVVAARASLFVELVAIPTPWVHQKMAVTSAELQEWKEAPADSVQLVLVKGAGDAGAKKKAQALLDRIKKGEDFGKVAREASEDPSKDSGGEYPAAFMAIFVEPLRDAYAKLKVGEVAPALVETKFGYHVLKKSKPSDELLTREYRSANAHAVAKKLASELSARWKSGAVGRAALSEAVTAVLGEAANADADRPKSIVVEREKLGDSRLPDDVKSGLARFAEGAKVGEVLDAPIVSPIPPRFPAVMPSLHAPPALIVIAHATGHAE